MVYFVHKLVTIKLYGRSTYAGVLAAVIIASDLYMVISDMIFFH